MLTLEKAKETCCCRICGKPIQMPEGGFPKGWKESFGSMVWPIKIMLNFGKEFAHTDCVSCAP